MNTVALLPRLGCALLLALACGVALPAQTAAAKAGAQTALKAFESFYASKNEHVRRAAVDDLAGTDHHLITERLLVVAMDRSTTVRGAAIAALRKQRNERGLTKMRELLFRNRKTPPRLAVLEAWSSDPPEAAWNAVAGLVDERDWRLRAAVAEITPAFEADGEGRRLGLLVPLLEDKEVLVRLSAVRALERLGRPEGLRFAINALADRDWRIRAASIAALRKSRDKAAIDPLINCLASEQGRLLDDATAALQDLCDREFRGEHKIWADWWARAKHGFKVPTEAEKQAKRDREKREETEGGYSRSKPGKGEYPPYHGIKTRSRRMIFVIDTSSSMTESVALDARDPAAVALFESRYGHLESRVKIDIAREELIALIAALPKHARFDLITFDSTAERWAGKLRPANQGTKNKAIKFLAKLTPKALVPSGRGAAAAGGRTNTYAAIATAFGLFRGDENDDDDYKTDADTVFLLTDGMPTTGPITEPQPFVDWLSVINAKAGMVIHTIGFGASNRALLSEVARRTKGQFVRVGGPPDS